MKDILAMTELNSEPTFPESERIVFRENPLCTVLCRLSFPPILKISTSKPAEFQDRIRNRYPQFREGPMKLEGLPPGIPKQALAQVLGMIRRQPDYVPAWLFSDQERSREITLIQHSVVLAASVYECWEEFAPEIRLMESALWESYQPTFLTGLGLRYQNVIDRDKLGMSTLAWSDLLEEFILGPIAVHADKVRTARYVTEIQLAEVPGAVVRIMHGYLNDGNPGKFVIDSDFIIKRKLQREDIWDVLEQFRKHAGRLFRNCLTNRLRERLGSA